MGEDRDLIIVGGGIAGLNALAVASGYLSRDSRVVLIDRRPQAGGMWLDTYDFVRLHQPHAIFTAGKTPWQHDLPASHLAARHEVVDHLGHCVDVARAKVDLDERYGWLYVSHEESGGVVSVVVRGPDGRTEVLTTRRLIKAFGNDVVPSSPLAISSSAALSTTPEELPGTIASRRGDTAPVWIVGSGKTAMDVALMLGRECPGRQVNMLTGSGTFFSRRETFFPSGPRRWFGGTRINAMLRDVSLRFDGTNEAEVAAWFVATYGISPTPDARHFFTAYLSQEECTSIRTTVRRTEPGHLEDVVDTSDGPALVLRQGRSVPIPQGTWIVNCTGYLVRGTHAYERFASDTGNVVSIQLRSSMMGPFTPFAGYYLTHLMLRGKIHDARLYELDVEALAGQSRSVAIWASIVLAVYNLGRIARTLPPSVIMNCGLDFDRWYPAPRRLAGATAFLANQPRDARQLRRTLETVGKRFDVRVGVVEPSAAHAATA